MSYALGLPSDAESYIQETGCAGRDNNPSSALLYYGGSDMLGTRVSIAMQEYYKLKHQCRRKSIF